MKKWRILAWFTFLLTFVSMVIAVWQFQKDGSDSSLNFFQYSFNGNWCMVSLDNAGAQPQAYDHIPEMVSEALAAGNYQEVYLPYKGKSNPGDLVVFETIIFKEHLGLTLRFSSADTAVCVFLDGKLLYQYGFGADGTLEEIT